VKTLLATAICLLLLASSASVPLRANPRQDPGGSSLSRGHAAFRAGRFADAAREYQRTLESDPGNGAAHTGLVRALLKQDRVAEAARAAERACADAPDEASLLVACGDVCFRQGNFARAEQMYAAAVAANPDCARGHWGLGRVDLIERRNRSARQQFVRAYELDPDDPNIVLDWAFTRPSRKECVAAAERSLTLAANANEDVRTLIGIRARIAILKALGERDTFVVADPRRAYRLELREALGPEGPLHAYRLFALVNGQKLRLTLDTGTSGIYLNRKAAERSHLVRLADGVPVRGVGDEGTRNSFVAIADTLQVGNLEMRHCEIKVDSGHALDDTDGLIGTDVFSHFLVRLNFPGRVMELLPPGAGEKSIAEDFWGVERQIRPGFTPVHVFGHLLLADTRINNVPGFLLIVDSGAPTHVLSTTAANRITGLHVTNAIVRGVSGLVRETLATGRVMLTFGNLATPGKFLAVNLDEQNRRQGTEIGGVIGLDALRQFDLTIDYTNGLVRLDHEGAR
jgi:tetratricopeptide (TPR) repeat protein